MSFSNLSHYRKAIYKMLDEEYDCDWFKDDIDYSMILNKKAYEIITAR